ncbi:RloB family protein [Desulfobacula sp.]
MGSENLYHFKKRKQLKRKIKIIKEYKDSILIVCEGEKTEPNYFQSFPVSNIRVKTIGTGRNTESLVVQAIKKWEDFSEENEFYEKLWCVFDRDSFSQQSFDGAFKMAISEEKRINRKYKRKVGRNINISIAYSNEAFELWYLLHFDYIDSALSRSEYKRMLTERMGEKYKKNDPSAYNFFENLSKGTNNQKGQIFAIKNAKKLRSNINNNPKRNHNPSTKVDLLVEELNKYLKN